MIHGMLSTKAETIHFGLVSCANNPDNIICLSILLTIKFLDDIWRLLTPKQKETAQGSSVNFRSAAQKLIVETKYAISKNKTCKYLKRGIAFLCSGCYNIAKQGRCPCQSCFLYVDVQK